MASIRSQISWLSIAEVLELVQADSSDPKVLRVLDVGGGTGADAVQLATQGHRVTVVDQSSNALAALERRAQEAGVEITALQIDGEDLNPDLFTELFDVALCHHVVETASDPELLLRSTASVLGRGGVLSVQVPHLIAFLRSTIAAGEIELAQRCANTAAADWDVDALGPRRYLIDDLTALVSSAGFRVVGTRGVRVLSDVAPSELGDGDGESLGRLLQMEKSLRGRPEFASVSSGLQALGRLD